MSNTKRHVSHPQHHSAHKFMGEQNGKPLVEWLNQNAKTPVYRRVIRLLKNLGDLDKLMPHGQWIPDPLPERPLVSLPGTRSGTAYSLSAVPSADYVKKIRQIDRQLAQYPMRPRLTAAKARLMQEGGISPAPTRHLWEWHDQGEPAAMAVHNIVKLEEEGLLGRVRECKQCAAWLFARFSHQRFCGAKCQLENYKSSEEWKEHRRKWMKEYRKTQVHKRELRQSRKEKKNRNG